MSPPAATIQALCRANLGILKQKLHLLNVMRTTFGDAQAKTMYAKTCPIVEASIGQHIRHSMDHLELASQVVASSSGSGERKELHYDLRKRGGQDEHDLEEAQQRIERVVRLLTEASQRSDNAKSNQEVQAYFVLSGDDPNEFQLPTTVEREMGFAAHHAIHHMALVKIIAKHTLGIASDALPPDFGRAPSTVVHDNSLSSNDPPATPQ
jgi:hypothetical protein